MQRILCNSFVLCGRVLGVGRSEKHQTACADEIENRSKFHNHCLFVFLGATNRRVSDNFSRTEDVLLPMGIYSASDLHRTEHIVMEATIKQTDVLRVGYLMQFCQRV